MNQACVRNDTIDAGNHHGRPQYRSFLRFLTSQERNVIWLLLAIAFLPVDGLIRLTLGNVTMKKGAAFEQATP